MKGIYTILLLLLSNVFMTLAWYGHLRLQEAGVSKYWPLIGVIAFSWGIAFFEYCCQVPANRIGFEGHRRPVLAHPAQSDPGGSVACRLYRHRQPALPRPTFAMEPPRSLRLLDSRGLFRLYEISPNSHPRLQSVKLGARQDVK